MQSVSIELAAPQAEDNGLMDIFSTLADRLETFWNGFKNTAREAFGKAKETVSHTVTNVVNNVRESVGNVFSNVKETVTNVVGNIRESVGNVFSNIKETGSGLWSKLKESGSGLFSTVKESFYGIFGRRKKGDEQEKDEAVPVSAIQQEYLSEMQKATMQTAVLENRSGLHSEMQREMQTEPVQAMQLLADGEVRQLQPAAVEQVIPEKASVRQFAKFCDKVEIVLPQGTPEEHVDILLNELMRRINDAVA